MATSIGPTFGDELIAAGLGGLPIAWGSDGSVTGLGNLSSSQLIAFNAVLAAHNGRMSTLLGYAQRLQKNLSECGLVVNANTTGAPLNVFVDTNDKGLIYLQGAYLLAVAAPATVFNWVQDNGVAVTLNATQIGNIYTVIHLHLQSLFTVLTSVAYSIQAGTITTTAQIDAQFATVSP